MMEQIVYWQYASFIPGLPLQTSGKTSRLTWIFLKKDLITKDVEHCLKQIPYRKKVGNEE